MTATATIGYGESTTPLGPKPTVNLVDPYIRGDGRNFSTFLIYHDCPNLHPGMIMCTNSYQWFRIITNLDVIVDLFENIQVSECILKTNDSNDIVDVGVSQIHYLYSAQTE